MRGGAAQPGGGRAADSRDCLADGAMVARRLACRGDARGESRHRLADGALVPGLFRIGLPIVVLAVAGGITLALVQTRPEVEREARAPAPIPVRVLIARRTPTTFVVDAQGEVRPRTQTTLISEVSGPIVSVAPSFLSGGFFSKGELLVGIDPRIYNSRLKRARANVARAQTQVATETALAGYARKDWQRLQELDAAAGVPSELTLRKPQLAAALADLDLAEAELLEAQGDLQRTSIRAPYDGMVREKLSDLGQFVKPGDRLASIFAVDYAEVRLPLKQADLAFLDLPEDGDGTPAPVTLWAEVAGRRHEWAAAIVRSEGVFDAMSRVLYAVAQVEDPYRRQAGAEGEPLRMGAFVQAAIRGRQAGPLFEVPRHALHRGATLWLVDGDNRLRAAQVQVVRAETDSIYVDGGLAEGDRICITPMTQPLPGLAVQVL